jgi:hypothetical protein
VSARRLRAEALGLAGRTPSGRGWSSTTELNERQRRAEAAATTPDDKAVHRPKHERSYEERELLGDDGSPTGTILTTWTDQPVAASKPAPEPFRLPGVPTSGYIVPEAAQAVIDRSQELKLSAAPPPVGDQADGDSREQWSRFEDKVSPVRN